MTLIKNKETASKAVVRPTIEDGSCIWNPHEKGPILKLVMVQRRAARFVKKKSTIIDLASPISELEWNP